MKKNLFFFSFIVIFLVLLLIPKQATVVSKTCEAGSLLHLEKRWIFWWMIPGDAAKDTQMDLAASSKLLPGHILTKGDYTVMGFMLTPKGKIVCAVKNIQQGTIVSKDQLTEREILQSKIPQGALTSQTLAVDRVAKYDLQKGNILCRHDLTTKESIGMIPVSLSEDYLIKLKKLKGENQSTEKLVQELLKEKIDEGLAKSK